ALPGGKCHLVGVTQIVKKTRWGVTVVNGAPSSEALVRQGGVAARKDTGAIGGSHDWALSAEGTQDLRYRQRRKTTTGPQVDQILRRKEIAKRLPRNVAHAHGCVKVL